MIRTIALVAIAPALLGAAAPDDAAEGPRDCIDLSVVTSRGAEDGQTIRFDLIGGRTYRNRLPGRCPGLRHASQGFGALAFETYGGRLCRGDRVRVVDPAAGRSAYNMSIPCLLGDFVPAAARAGEEPGSDLPPRP